MANPREAMGTWSDRPQAIELVKREDRKGLRALLRARPEEADVQDSATGMTALHVAAASNLPEFVQELLPVCDPTILDLAGRSAATVADHNHTNEELIELLSEAIARTLEAKDRSAFGRIVPLGPKQP